MPNVLARTALAAVLAASVLLLQACQKDKTHSGGCLSGAADCKVSSPCTDVSFTCASGGNLDARVLTATDTPPGGSNALAARGDILLQNDKVTVVLAGIGNGNFLDPNGGSLLDLSTNGDNNDGLNQILQVTGVLPGDSVRYTSHQLIKEANRVGVQFKGELLGHPEIPVHTLYELRPCDQGVRVRSEIVNRSPDQQFWTLTDGFYWSKREPIPFTPEPGAGFEHPSFGLTTINNAFKLFPYMAASMHAEPYSSYATVGCNVKQLEGFNSETISAAGMPRQVVGPRDFLVFERFIAVAKSGDTQGAARIALDVRKQAFGESFVTLTGTVQRAGALRLDNERETSILVSTGKLADEAARRTPWAQVVPNADGSFSAVVPSGQDYVVEVHAFGHKQAERELSRVSADTTLEPFVLPSTAMVRATVLDGLNGQPMNAQLLLVPADDTTRNATSGSFHGQFGTCAPWLGPPPGSSPACNRVLTHDTGPVAFEVPMGTFHIYASRGPFWTIERKTVNLTPTNHTLTFTLRKLPLQPNGTLNADLHVHGAASFDSSIPDVDRVRSFSAGDVDVIAATDHDVVYDYSLVVRSLGLQDRITTINGLETTGHIPYLYIPKYSFPLVVGHYNFWPLKYDPTAPRNGSPNDEFKEPGEIFDAMEDRWSSDVPLIELNHPWADAEFGRDLGFPRAIYMDLRKNLPAEDDGSNMGVYVRARGTAKNNSHHAQEVMNGTDNTQYLQYRAFWFYVLNQGQLKTGTANSDSHSLVDNVLGLPRNVVYTDTLSGPSFDVARFNTSLRNGQSLGTNGPVIEATIDTTTGPESYGLTLRRPAAGAKLKLKVSAAPWVPVQEVRIVVNGVVVKTFDTSATTPADPFGTAGLLRLDTEVALSELATGGGKDAWLVIEAGRKLPVVGDLGGGLDNGPDGMPDTTDNNGDGKVDAADVAQGRRFGPLVHPAVPTSPADPQFHFSHVVVGGYPSSFTNPFVLDLNGNGTFDAPGVPTGGN
ncbi:MAG TPA: CehA/McbA family metallohydrolase [Myxococcaceae bacterium]|nr:CehA/McbA family metallohydrolase [Myxococcaceae bacterium]